MTAESKTSARRIEAASRLAEAVSLRMARASYAAIAAKCGYSDESGARKAVERALAKTRAATAEKVEEMRQLDLAKLDEIEMRLTNVIRGKNKPAEVAIAGKAIVAVMKRRAELTGLDKPTEINVRVEDPRERLARLMGAVIASGAEGEVDPEPQPE